MKARTNKRTYAYASLKEGGKALRASGGKKQIPVMHACAQAPTNARTHDRKKLPRACAHAHSLSRMWIKGEAPTLTQTPTIVCKRKDKTIETQSQAQKDLSAFEWHERHGDGE